MYVCIYIYIYIHMIVYYRVQHLRGHQGHDVFSAPTEVDDGGVIRWSTWRNDSISACVVDFAKVQKNKQ